MLSVIIISLVCSHSGTTLVPVTNKDLCRMQFYDLLNLGCSDPYFQITFGLGTMDNDVGTFL